MDIIHKIEMKQDSIIEMVKDFKYQMNSYEKIYPSTKKWLNPSRSSIRRDRPDASVRK
jgi:hypothetical protein